MLCFIKSKPIFSNPKNTDEGKVKKEDTSELKKM